MQDFTIFDMVILGITLVLGLKGLFRGLIKEVFGIIGIIGAIFVASRVSEDIGGLIAPFLAIENDTTIKLIGFIVALIAFWVIVYILGVIISKIFNASGLGILDRIFGFIFGAAKIFLIFSVIAYALYQVNSFKKVIDEKTAGSIVMPHLLSVGSYIIKLDTSVISENIGKTVDNVVTTTKNITSTENKNTQPTSEKIEESINTTKEEISKSVENTIDGVKESIKEDVVNKVEEQIQDTKNSTEEQIDSVKNKLEDIVNEATKKETN